MNNCEMMMKTFMIANAIARVGRETLNQALEEYNINIFEYYVLYYLDKVPGSTQYNLLKYTLQTKSRINQVISKLEKMGYLEKKIEMVGSLLKKPIYVTELGRKIVVDGITIMNSKITSKLSVEEKKRYIHCNEEMTKILKDMVVDIDVKLPEYI